MMLILPPATLAIRTPIKTGPKNWGHATSEPSGGWSCNSNTDDEVDLLTLIALISTELTTRLRAVNRNPN